MIRKQKAYAASRVLSFQGPRKHFTFQNYITAHQKAHNELDACKEPVPETKKVTDFLEGISDPTMSARLANVYGDEGKLGEFTKCQLYLQTIAASTSVHKKTQRGREVAGIEGDSDKTANRKPKKLEAKSYPRHIWDLFSESEKAHVTGLRRKEKKERTGKKRKEKGKQ